MSTEAPRTIRPLPTTVYETLAGLGGAGSPEALTTAIEAVAPLIEATSFRALRTVRDLAYGEHERHRLDVHAPETTDAARPVLVFVHGGGFVGGDKAQPGRPHYDHLGGWAVGVGLVGVTLNYRLAPAARWPAAAEDVAAALRWIGAHIAEYGGDPRRIVLMGCSAGASHVAGVLAGHGGQVPDGIAAGVLMSGIYDPSTAEQNLLLHAYYGADSAQHGPRSTLDALAAASVPLLVSVAEHDIPDFHQQALALLGAVHARRGALPVFVTVQDHTHMSQVLTFGVDDPAYADALERFLDGLL